MELKKSVYFIGGIILSLSLLFSCTIGMGQSLDLEAPQLSVTSHMSGSKVGLEVDLSGTCTDNNAVTRVSIKNVENDFTFEDAVVSGTSWKTHLSLSKDFEGDRTFIITAHDAVGNASTKSYAILVLSIDETGPNDEDWYLDRGNSIRTEVAELEELKATNLYLSKNKDIPQNEKFTVYGSLYDAMSISEVTLGLYTVNGKLLIEKTYSSDPDNADKYIGENKSIFSPAFEFTHDELKDLIDDDGSTLESGCHYLGLKCYLEDEHGNNFTRNIGYMVWWPESDLPGIYQNEIDKENSTLSVLIESSISLDIFDDDGLEEIYYALKADTIYDEIPGTTLAEKCNAVIENDEGIRDKLLLIDAAANEVGGSATDLAEKTKREDPVQIKTPSYPSTMYLIACAKDINGKWNCRIIYTTISDASSPMLFIESPRNNEKPQMNGGTNSFTIQGYALGKNESSSLQLVYISGDATSESKKSTAKKILDGELTADPAKGEILEDITLMPATMDEGLKKQAFEKTFDIIDDLSKYRGDKETSYFFMFRLQGTGSVVDQIYQLNKDIALPTITVAEPNNMQAIDYTKHEDDNDVGLTIKFKASKESGLAIVDQKVTYIGKNETYEWTLGEGLIKDGEYFVKTFKQAELKVIHETNPQPQFEITVKDALGYESTEQRTVVLTTLPSLEEITSENPSKTYIKDKVITFQAKFTDAVRVRDLSSTKKPRLKIKYSESDTAEKWAEYSTGSGTTTLQFTYKVPAGAESKGISIATLADNKIIDLNGCKIVPVAAGDGDAYITTPSKVLVGKTFALDGVAPTITTLNLSSDIAVENADGNFYLKADNKLTVTIALSEKVSISGSPSLQMKVKGKDSVTPLVFDFKDINEEGTELTFEHIVKAETANGTVQITKATCFDANNLKLISDVNDNGLVLSTSAAVTDTKFIVDTEKPAKLTVNITAKKNLTNVNGIDTYIVSPSLSITGNEAGSKVEYSLDNGVSWNDYSTAVSIPNGSYKITARQTDKAGNVSDLTDPLSIVVDSAFPSIVDFTVSSPDGNYKVGSKVQFALSFSDKVKVASGNTSKVTFESVNTPKVEKTANVVATDAAGQNTVIFEYTVQAGDNLKGIVLKSVSFNSFTDTKGTASGTQNKTDKTETRSGIILDGIAPALTVAEPKMTGNVNDINVATSGINGTASGISTETDNSKFKITLTFAENVYKEVGNIILQRKGDWAIPAVMNRDEFLSVYNKMDATNKDLIMKTSGGKELLHGQTGIAVGPYRKITHGIKLDGSGKKYVPDESTKYVLAYELGLYEGEAALNDGTATGTFNAKVSDIRSAFESVDYHRHYVDVASDNVKITGSTVEITFSETIEDGREWELIIPPTAFRDNAENFYKGMNLDKLKDAEKTKQNITTDQQTASDKYSVWSNNVAQPVVRVDRYTHGWGANEPKADGTLTKITVNNGKYKTTCAANSGARIAPTGYARSRIDCETPGASILYKAVNSGSATYNASTTDESTNKDIITNYRSHIADATKEQLEFTTGGTAYKQGDNIIIGDTTYTSARKDYISCYATKNDFTQSKNGMEGIFRTVVYVHTENAAYPWRNGQQVYLGYLSINIEGGTATGGQPNVSGFPLRDATSENDPTGAGRYSKNAYNLANSQTPGKNFVWVSYEIISSNWAILVCRSNHAQDYALNNYGDVAYITKVKDWDGTN